MGEASGPALLPPSAVDGYVDAIHRFDEIFCGLLSRLYYRAAFLSGEHAAEDLVHDVYLKLVANPQRFLGHPEPYAYVSAALVSVSRDGWRRRRRQVVVEEVPDQGYDAYEASAARRHVWWLLGRLSKRQAAAVILVDLDGYTIDQAAEILGVHRGTVSRSRARALSTLRALAKEDRGQS